jgi:predicted metalloenzyme YecM
LNKLFGDYDSKTATINKVFKEIGIDRDELTQLDHFCYRTETIAEYRKAVDEFSDLGRNLGEQMVQKRPITVIELSEPILSNGWTIDFFEIAAPKPTSFYPSGLEHAEFVVRRTLASFEQQHAALPFDKNDNVLNPELKYRDKGISVKFHQLSLGAVAMIEARQNETGLAR